jgi:hypothetical protein
MQHEPSTNRAGFLTFYGTGSGSGTLYCGREIGFSSDYRYKN